MVAPPARNDCGAPGRRRGRENLCQKGKIDLQQICVVEQSLNSIQMNRFFIYEEYGAKYELMIKDVASAHRTMPQWESYQKGLEALAASLGPACNHDDQSKKSLTIGDLLVKASVPFSFTTTPF